MSTPEGSAEYIARTNLKGIVEWLTARCILHRPDDPLAFCGELIGEKLATRPQQTAYNPADPNGYLKATYDDALNAADERGVVTLPPKPAAAAVAVAAASGVAETTAAPAAPQAPSAAAVDAVAWPWREMQEMSELAPRGPAADAIVAATTKVFGASSGAVFWLDQDSHLLHLVGGPASADKLSVAPGRGLVGAAAGASSPIVVPEPQRDPRFDAAVDLAPDTAAGGGGGAQQLQAGDGIMAAALLDAADEPVGVLCLRGKAAGNRPFPPTDAEIIQVICRTAAVALKNAAFYSEKERERERYQGMVEIVEAASGGGANLGINHLLYTMTRRLPSVCDAHKCTVFVVDEQSNELWALQGELNLRLPKTKGIAGAVATTGQIINLPDAYQDSRFNPQVDKESGYHTKAVLAMPLSIGAKVVGVVQLINKCDRAGGMTGEFSTRDVEMLRGFLVLLGPLLLESRLFRSFEQKNKEGGGNEMRGGGGGGGSSGGGDARDKADMAGKLSLLSIADDEGSEGETGGEEGG